MPIAVTLAEGHTSGEGFQKCVTRGRSSPVTVKDSDFPRCLHGLENVLCDFSLHPVEKLRRIFIPCLSSPPCLLALNNHQTAPNPSIRQAFSSEQDVGVRIPRKGVTHTHCKTLARKDDRSSPFWYEEKLHVWVLLA